ncbi:MAG: hypothetical protein LBV34_08575 [Nocardiopsaceae bacterium]|jgi:hypothetical protein|nr:hypothetical protein [Nocardiopsaceae bacterium]
MKLGRRKSPDRSPDRDGHLTFLTPDEADLVRSLVREAFAEHGREVTVFADHVQDDQGAQFGLWNVAAACRNEPRGQAAWARVVANHVRRVLDTTEEDVFEGLTADQVAARTYARLLSADSVPEPGWFSYAREIAPGLLEVLAFDLPETVVMLSDETVARFGGAVALREAGLANLRALPVEHQEQISVPDGGHFQVLLGESAYTASRVLVMSELLAQMFGPVTAPYGVLAAVPNRSQAVLHVIRDETFVLSINHMTRFALAGASDSPGPLSPNVYWWRADTWQQVSYFDNEKITVRLDNELGDVLEQLTGQR